MFVIFFSFNSACFDLILINNYTQKIFVEILNAVSFTLSQKYSSFGDSIKSFLLLFDNDPLASTKTIETFIQNFLNLQDILPCYFLTMDLFD